MGLLKQIDTAFDTEPVEAYFRLVEVNLNYADQVGRIVFAGYRSKDARDAGKQMLAVATFDLSKDGKKAEYIEAAKEGDPPVLSRPRLAPFTEFVGAMKAAEDPTAFLYTTFKTHPEFADAKDA